MILYNIMVEQSFYCTSQDCNKKATFSSGGLPDICGIHKTEDHVYFKTKCVVDGCKKQINYGFDTPTHCGEHKLEGQHPKARKCSI